MAEPADAPPRPNPVIRLLWVGIVACVLVLIVQVGRALTADTSPQRPELRADEIDVEQALIASGRRPVAVRGYVFLRERFPPQLCQARSRDARPRCIGPVLVLTGLDTSRLDLRTGKDGDVPVAWSRHSVSLLGMLRGAELAVREVLS